MNNAPLRKQVTVELSKLRILYFRILLVGNFPFHLNCMYMQLEICRFTLTPQIALILEICLYFNFLLENGFYCIIIVLVIIFIFYCAFSLQFGKIKIWKEWVSW